MDLLQNLILALEKQVRGTNRCVYAEKEREREKGGGRKKERETQRDNKTKRQRERDKHRFKEIKRQKNCDI